MLENVREIYFIFVFFGCVSADAPNFISGCGITVRSVSKVNNNLYDLIVTSEQVRGEQEIRILLPHDYATSGPQRRYPVLYLLHGGGRNATEWTSGTGKAQEILANQSVIAVTPNGDPYGWYTNWMHPGKHAPQNWRTFHNEQLIPWIDLNLRTVSKKEGRAIAGMSMGGLGAMRYAQIYPQLYAYVTSFSGALDLVDWRVQIAVFSTDEYVDQTGSGPFGPPFFLTNSSGFVLENPLTHASALRTVDIALYTGNVGIVEETVHACTVRMHHVLNSLNITHYFDDYGNGKSMGPGCAGDHDMSCWTPALMNVVPRIMAVLEQQP